MEFLEKGVLKKDESGVSDRKRILVHLELKGRHIFWFELSYIGDMY